MFFGGHDPGAVGINDVTLEGHRTPLVTEKGKNPDPAIDPQQEGRSQRPSSAFL